MKVDQTLDSKLTFRPLTPESWNDLEALFGPHGAYSGCWCMWWRTTRREFQEQAGDGNRRAMKYIVDSGKIPGLLAYDGGRAVGWCSVAQREDYPSLNRSRVLKPLDGLPVWSIVCLYVGKACRGQGVSQALITGAVYYVRQQGGQIVEAYPTTPRGGRLPPVSSFMGLPAVFAQAGFQESARPSEAKVVMRLYIGEDASV